MNTTPAHDIEHANTHEATRAAPATSGSTIHTPEHSCIRDPRNHAYSDVSSQSLHQSQDGPLDHMPRNHPDYPLFASIRTRLPVGTTEEMAAHVALRAKLGGVRANELEKVEIHNGYACILGRIPGDRAVVNMADSPPSLQETLLRSQMHDQQQAQQLAQQQCNRTSSQPVRCIRWGMGWLEASAGAHAVTA